MKKVCICGSTKFKAEMMKEAAHFTYQGYIVLMPHVFAHADDIDLGGDQKRRLDLLHLEKIKISDLVYVVNPSGYIGQSTRAEIQFAENHGKEIQYSDSGT